MFGVSPMEVIVILISLALTRTPLKAQAVMSMPNPPRRWFAFRLRTLFAVVAVVAVASLVLRPVPTFEQRYFRLRIGWTMPEVRACLGAPSAVHIYRSVTIWEYEARGITHRVRFRATQASRIAFSMRGRGERVRPFRGDYARLSRNLLGHVLGRQKIASLRPAV